MMNLQGISLRRCLKNYLGANIMALLKKKPNRLVMNFLEKAK